MFSSFTDCNSCGAATRTASAMPEILDSGVSFLCSKCASPACTGTECSKPIESADALKITAEGTGPIEAGSPESIRESGSRSDPRRVPRATIKTWLRQNRQLWMPVVCVLGLPLILSLRSKSASATMSPRVTFDSLSTKPKPSRQAYFQVSAREPGVLNALSFNSDQSLRQWHHPISGSRLLPDQPDRRFGARREGDRPGECDRGHCGVDLMGEIGTPIHAALDGTVIRAQHNPDASGGRFVKLDHNGELISYYMHLDTIAKGLKGGTIIKAGQFIGTLGDSNIQSSPPHLHFSVAKLNERGGRYYVDPEPMLRDAQLLQDSLAQK